MLLPHPPHLHPQKWGFSVEIIGMNESTTLSAVSEAAAEGVHPSNMEVRWEGVGCGWVGCMWEGREEGARMTSTRSHL